MLSNVKGEVVSLYGKSKKYLPAAGLVVLLAVSVSLRFINLSYSELQDDEKKTRISLIEGENLADFFLRQRKGPMQFLVAYIPNKIYSVRPDINEFAVRLPFTAANLAAVFVLYALVFRITKSHLASLLTSLLYSVNGFVVGFSRIAQYQSLNMLFSFLALYFFSGLKYFGSKFVRSAILGSFFTCLSILSHWDAIFYAVPSAYFLTRFLFRKDVTKKVKTTSIVAAAGVFALLCLPFLISYINNLISGQTGHTEYLVKRVGIEGSTLKRHRRIFELYNPLITLPLLITGLALSLGFIKRAGMLLVWFLLNFLALKLLMVTPKTHIYSYVVPAIITSGVSFYYFYEFLKKRLGRPAHLFLPVMLAVLTLLYIQSYQIFVDHSKEYPFDEKKILWHTNPVLMDEEIITFGFPHFRNWKEINKYIGPGCVYITNESKGISQIYVESDYGENRSCFYIVYIRRPFYVKNQNVIYAGVKDSKMVYKYVRDGETMVKVYRMK